MANGLLCREKRYSNGLAGKQYSVGERYFAELLIITCWGYPVLLEVLIDFAGDKETFSGTIFSWLLAEDNPVISC